MPNTFTNARLMYNVPIRMRDGVTLYCDVIRPDHDQPLPAILVRTSYYKEDVYSGTENWLINAFKAARWGYNFIVQDTRGTGCSEGVSDPLGHEDQDGYDTVEAIAAMPWCDGNVGMVGFSFLGYCCMEAAKLNPPHLKAIAPGMCGYWKNPFLLRYGVPTGGVNNWVFDPQVDVQALPGLDDATRAAIRLHPEKRAEILLSLAMDELEKLNPARDTPFGKSHRAMVEHLEDLSFYEEIGRTPSYHRFQIPTLHFTGWKDMELNTTIDNYYGCKEAGGNDSARQNVRLLIGPWMHDSALKGVYADTDLGPEASGFASGPDERILAWFDHFLKGQDNDYMHEKPVRLYINGRSQWIQLDQYPPKATDMTPYYLHSNGDANSRSGNGQLTPVSPRNEKPDFYTYNPAHPFRSINLLSNQWFEDQAVKEDRDDMLVYTTPVFDQSVTLCGPVKLHLYAASSAEDTDFACRLLLVDNQERAWQLQANLIRARYRNGPKQELLTPGQVNEYELLVGNVCQEVCRGFRLRIEIMSSLFPIADRNPNTADPVGFAHDFVLAHQQILHDAKHPSHVLLPVLNWERYRSE